MIRIKTKKNGKTGTVIGTHIDGEHKPYIVLIVVSDTTNEFSIAFPEDVEVIDNPHYDQSKKTIDTDEN